VTAGNASELPASNSTGWSVAVVVSGWRPVLPTIARRWPILLVVALLLWRRAILLVIVLLLWRETILLVIALLLWRGAIATGRRRGAVSVGPGTIARPIIARRRRRWCWTRDSPKQGERQRRKCQRTDNGATDKAGVATVIATPPIMAAARIVASMSVITTMTPAGVRG
jgi:hypothetical protein